MMLSDDKISHTTHIVLKGLMEKGLITLKEDAGLLRREIKRTITSELKIGEDIDEAVRRKLESFSKKLVEGSTEWEVLYRKYFEEESARKGKR
ncbi:MAG: hypothetical protein A2077_04415 [Nitrospirae bacterium GWC2_46_6]|nr:MAG: hypothetical protein A2077_04415 [Nitrospirae bacterium GWC2_46_6]OGW22119.1 MAG: hypothetical protein A2Z82_06600 [Nitrospirae bacterium GWA2_46_11]OGW24335.1 MAG: hypothetical protein A2X55_00070 [Nitrospirae bacterium GWB2_47_37]HAK88422.1 DUF507 domain-containing protein [Nitrospiraceae bacterium]HCL81264.1 DUF507 domain-containing protein [Nitrospiraceae bacterium]